MVGCLVACASTDEVSETATGALLPEPPATPWALAATCKANGDRHRGVRADELARGVVRWQCGDLPTVSGDDRGQEYCEYGAYVGARRITRAAEAEGKAVTCLFTTLLRDAPEGAELPVARALERPENLGASIDPGALRMKGRTNSRGAADALLTEAAGSPRSPGQTRLAACFLASLAAPRRAGSIRAACQGDLDNDAEWAKAVALGVALRTESDPGYEEQEDLASCLAVEVIGVSWRSSDPHITQVAARAGQACGCRFNRTPATLAALPMGTWSSMEELPRGCRRASGDAEDAVALCELPREIASDPRWKNDLTAACNERFGKDIVLTLDLRGLARAGTCRGERGAFCSSFVGAVRP
jgi:hypothetical protein